MKSWPKYQGGWIGIAAAVAGTVIKSYSDRKAAKQQQDTQKEMTEEGFQRQAWLDQQQRKYALEDRKYKEDAVASFRPYAPESAKTFNGQPVGIPAVTDTSGLADWDPNKKGNLPLMPIRTQQNAG